MTRQALSIVILLCNCLHQANALADPCNASIDGLARVKLRMTLSEVIKVLGPGHLEYENEDDFYNTRACYSWKTRGYYIDVNFGKDGRAHSIIVGSKSRLQLLGRIRFNVNSYAQIAREFGIPKIDEEPTFGEGDFVYYSYGYTCPTPEASKVLFTIGIQCKHSNMGKCLDVQLLRKVPISQVEVSLQK